jgi:hypothetical protein
LRLRGGEVDKGSISPSFFLLKCLDSRRCNTAASDGAKWADPQVREEWL